MAQRLGHVRRQRHRRARHRQVRLRRQAAPRQGGDRAAMAAPAQGQRDIGHGQASADQQQPRLRRHLVQHPVLPRPTDVAAMHRQARADAGQGRRRQRADRQHHHVADHVLAIGQEDAETLRVAFQRHRLLAHPRHLDRRRGQRRVQVLLQVAAVQQPRQELQALRGVQPQRVGEAAGLLRVHAQILGAHVQQMLRACRAVGDTASVGVGDADQGDAAGNALSGQCRGQHVAAESCADDRNSHGSPSLAVRASFVPGMPAAGVNRRLIQAPRCMPIGHQHMRLAHERRLLPLAAVRHRPRTSARHANAALSEAPRRPTPSAPTAARAPAGTRPAGAAGRRSGCPPCSARSTRTPGPNRSTRRDRHRRR